MTRALVLCLALCLPIAASAGPKPPVHDATAATQARPPGDTGSDAIDAWLSAFNSGERARLQAFRERHAPDMDVDRMLGFHERTGGFQLVRREPDEGGKARALLREAGSDTIARLQIGPGADGKVRVQVEAIDPPDDLRVARLGERAAIDALVAKADAAAASDAFSGVLLVARGDSVLLQRGWGLADRIARTPVTPDTRFRLGSMNKMFTAVAALQLVQAGKLSLDTTVGEVLAGYPNAEIAKVTVRQLLTHAGGTGDIFGPEFDRERLSLRTHGDYVRLYGARGPTHVPGERQEYSNYGFLLLGALIEQVSGQSYYDYMAQHVFAPAGMADTGSEPESIAVPGRARAYTRKDGAWVDAADTLPWRGTAAGGGYSTAGDLLKFARALQGGTLLSPGLLAEATRNQTPWYGYGFMVREQDGVRMYGHGGGAPGMGGDLRIYPSLGVVVVGLANLDPPAVQRLVDYYLLRMPMRAR